jgi:hypothetical protein
MITGIGTPSNQSNIPRPIIASMKFLDATENAEEGTRFQRGNEVRNLE